MHAGELRVDDGVVASLIAEQAPMWSSLPLVQAEPVGLGNIVYRLGSERLVRLPRLPVHASRPRCEFETLQLMWGSLPCETPEPLLLGEPTDDYPSSWTVLGWIDGEAVALDNPDVLNTGARWLGDIVRAIRLLPTERGPTDQQRGEGCRVAEEVFLPSLGALPDHFDQSAILEVWDRCVSAPQRTGPGVWFHGDLHGGNLLQMDGGRPALIDWELAGVGDPAIDLIAAWWLFDEPGRSVFRSVVSPDDDEWMRGMGWALYMAVSAIPYYVKTNPPFVREAEVALMRILSVATGEVSPE